MCDLETSRIGAPYIYIYIYMYDISSLRVNDLREEHRLMVLESTVLRKTLGLKRSEVTLVGKATYRGAA